MRRRRNPFGDDVADVLLVGALGVAAYFVYRYFYPSQNDTQVSGPDPSTSPAAASTANALTSSVNSLFGSGGLLSPVVPVGPGALDVSAIGTNPFNMSPLSPGS